MNIQVNKATNNYGIFEIERHLHNYESWFGAAVTPSGETHVADRIGVGVNAFQIDAGNNTWGSWVQVLGSSDTPARTGKIYFDLHRIQIVAAERTSEYFIQVSKGATGDAGISADTYTDFVYKATSVAGRPAPIDLAFRRHPVGDLVWARCLCPGQNTATLDFYIGMHEYEK